jgi:hypothetical protein
MGNEGKEPHVIFVGNDWSEGHHELFVMDEAGERLASKRFSEGIEGLSELHRLLSSHASQPAEVVVGIETDRGLWVEALVAAGYAVYAVNPKAVARYRERHRPGGGKSDPGDAKVLADLVRTDRHNHLPLAGDSELAEGVKLLARAHQKLCWDQNRHANRLRSALREYYPAALATFSDLCDRDALAVLAKAPTPLKGRRLTLSQIRAALRQGGRKRGLDGAAARIQTGLRAPELEAPAALVDSLAAIVSAEVAMVAELGRQLERLQTQLTERFREHPDAAIYLSLPGIGSMLGARMLGEFGDDPNRYSDPKSRRNYAGTSPLTVASGKSKAVIARHVRNNWLHQTAIRWAFCALKPSPGARAFYDERRRRGDSHPQALRVLANRLVGILHFCLQTQTPYDEEIAWHHRGDTTSAIAA